MKIKNHITFFLNGKKYSVDKNINLNNLINYLKLNQNKLILEHNHNLCNIKNCSKYQINENDKIEIITIVGGG